MQQLMIYFTVFVSFVSFSFSQQKLEDDIEMAYQNAKKGIYWALSNIPPKKIRIDNNLIRDDVMIADVKLSKQVNGVKIESVGYFHSNEVKIIIYKSNDNLIKEGYIKVSQTKSEPETK